uniref:Uncharacterized protein n=1 Tax=Ailuropoda melanoleuca TaxID=9646 RepID=A0A7N5KAH8_AILME
MCILPNIILPKPIQHFKAKIKFFSVFLLYLKHFSFSFFFFLIFHFLCFSSLSPVLLPGPSPDVCLLVVVLFKNILSMPLSASVR